MGTILSPKFQVYLNLSHLILHLNCCSQYGWQEGQLAIPVRMTLAKVKTILGVYYNPAVCKWCKQLYADHSAGCAAGLNSWPNPLSSKH